MEGKEKKKDRKSNEFWPRGVIGRNALLPHTTKTRITTNIKTRNNQNCQKIKLHGTLTTKELKKHSSRPVGRAETGQAGRTHSKANKTNKKKQKKK